MPKNKKLFQFVVSALLALAFVQFYLKKKEGGIIDLYRNVEVFTASRDIPPRTELSESFITTQRVPLKYVAPGAVVGKISEEDMKKVKGKVSIAAIPEGSQIVMSNLMDPSVKDTGVAPLIPPGKRGYLLRLGNMDVSKLILPGDHIDLLATFSVKREQRTIKVTNTILQNILVVAVGRELKKLGEDSKGNEKNVESLVLTLALEPAEAQILALAQAESNGDIMVVVRPRGDSNVNNVQAVTPGTLVR